MFYLSSVGENGDHQFPHVVICQSVANVLALTMPRYEIFRP
jgi:hypothetical protein